MLPKQRSGGRYGLALLGVILFFCVGCGSSGNAAPPPSSVANATTTPTQVSSSSTVPQGNTTPLPTQVGSRPNPTQVVNTPLPTQVVSTPTTTSAINWGSLEQKPLHLPTVPAGSACPVTASQHQVVPDYQYALGQGPIYLVSQVPVTQVQLNAPGPLDAGSPWQIAKVYWEIAATYHGPAIIRGQQLDGSHTSMFNGGVSQTQGNAEGTEPLLNELRLVGNGQWSTNGTFLRLQAGGCYGLQIDGPTFSEVIVVQATLS